jgi:hypothetical protein
MNNTCSIELCAPQHNRHPWPLISATFVILVAPPSSVMGHLTHQALMMSLGGGIATGWKCEWSGRGELSEWPGGLEFAFT